MLSKFAGLAERYLQNFSPKKRKHARLAIIGQCKSDFLYFSFHFILFVYLVSSLLLMRHASMLQGRRRARHGGLRVHAERGCFPGCPRHRRRLAVCHGEGGFVAERFSHCRGCAGHGGCLARRFVEGEDSSRRRRGGGRRRRRSGGCSHFGRLAAPRLAVVACCQAMVRVRKPGEPWSSSLSTATATSSSSSSSLAGAAAAKIEKGMGEYDDRSSRARSRAEGEARDSSNGESGGGGVVTPAHLIVPAGGDKEDEGETENARKEGGSGNGHESSPKRKLIL